MHVIIFLSSGLFVYWVTRTMQLLEGPEEAIGEALDCDLWRGRRFLMTLRAMFVPPQQFIG
jgi:hypothetical protein